jgi:hypothetical protein
MIVRAASSTSLIQIVNKLLTANLLENTFLELPSCKIHQERLCTGRHSSLVPSDHDDEDPDRSLSVSFTLKEGALCFQEACNIYYTFSHITNIFQMPS